MAPAVDPIGRYSPSYETSTKPIIDGNPKPVILADAGSIQNQAISAPFIIADASSAKPSIPTIELGKYTWSSSKEAFDEYLLGAKRLVAEYTLLRRGPAILLAPGSLNSAVGGVLLGRLHQYKMPTLDGRVVDYGVQELENPFYNDLKQFFRTHTFKEFEGGVDIMPDYFKDKVKNFVVSYGMYVASYGTQPGVKDAEDQLAAEHQTAKVLADLVFPNDPTFWTDISAGGESNKKLFNLLSKSYFPALKSSMIDLNMKIKKGPLNNAELESVINDINHAIKITASGFFLNKIPHSPQRVAGTIDALKVNLDQTGIKYSIK
jgi:hypothetical protein